MPDPSDLYNQQPVERSPEDLDARILAAAKAQADINAAEQGRDAWWSSGNLRWVGGAATAAVLVISLTFVFEPGGLAPGLNESDVFLPPPTSDLAIDNSSDAEPNLAGESQFQEVVVTARRRDNVLAEPAEIAQFSGSPARQLPDTQVTRAESEANILQKTESIGSVTDTAGADKFAAQADILDSNLEDAAEIEEQAMASNDEPDFDSAPAPALLRSELDLASAAAAQGAPEPTLVDVSLSISNILIDMHYASSGNFVGTPVDGYREAKALLTPEAARALANVQAELQAQGMSLKIFDAYRPQRAVDHFIRWSQTIDDPTSKSRYYPNIAKSELFSAGYLAERSSHSRGSTVDVTIVRVNDEGGTEELDMGSIFDFFDPRSWPSSTEVSIEAQENRAFLRDLMVANGFTPFATEWWHFTLEDEPYPDQYFDLPIE